MGLFSSQLSAKELAPICRQLATAYDAGIPIRRALSIVSDNTPRRIARDTLARMEDRIARGSSLGDAARAESHRLPPLLIELVTAGETGGRLDEMLRDMANYYEDRIAMQRKIISLMTLPALYLVAAWYLGTFALGLAGNFSLDARTTFSLTAYFEGYLRFQAIATGVFAFAFACIAVAARMGMLGWITGLAARVWPLRPVSVRFALARFFRGMALLIASGVNIKLCIERSAAVANNPYVARDLLRAVPRVAQGMTLTDAFAPCTSLTRTAREMMHVGEESGELDKALRKVADYHMAEASHAVQVAVRVAGVAAILAVGLVIGYVVISFWTQYFSLLDSI